MIAMIFMPPGGARHGTHRALLSAFHSHGGTPSSLDGENFREDPSKMDDDWGIPPFMETPLCWDQLWIVWFQTRLRGSTKPSVGTLGRWDLQDLSGGDGNGRGKPMGFL